MTKSLELLNNRISAKRYIEDFKLTDEQATELLESTRLAPSSFGLEPFRVLLIENKEIREELKEAWWNQFGITQSAGIMIWVGYREEYLTQTHFVEQVERNIPVEFKDIRDMMIGGAGTVLSTLEMTRDEWTARQAYISLGTVLNTAQELGLDTCPSEGFSQADVAKVLEKHNLIDTKNEKVLVGMFVGKVDTTQEFHHSFTKTRRPADKAYKIVK
ncbi:nitroreductase family protein [Spiroplasma sp. BIUS-1]|uniref:nitroreductase family protein n=1 Tax=Spiroplasma sp. BIUS-1 TaxID=216964 RepID=UPI001396DD54|nr:nitroreductase family protein [Spiroplasma sp. BIUS-1]QHX36736.1 nitroreductase [Spiroplasma sp. BIUS-1]